MQEQDQSTPSATDQPTVNRKALAFIFITVFLDLLGAGILLPVIPFFVRQFSTDGLMVGLLAVSYSAAQFVTSPALGVISDRLGRRPILLISVLGTGIGYFIFGFANSLWVLFAARVLDGITGGNFLVAEAYISDISSPENRAKNFGVIGAALGCGFILGPALGGWLSQIHLHAPAFVAGALSLLTAVFGFFVLPESLPPERRQQAPIAFKELNPLHQVWDALRYPATQYLLLASLAQNFALSALQTNFALFSFVRFGIGAQQNGLIFTYLGILAIVVQFGLIGRLVKQFSERRLVIVGLALMAVGYANIALAPTAWALYPSITFVAVGGGMATPSLLSMVTKQVSAQQQGSILGAKQALENLAQLGGPVWAGFTFDALGPTAPYWSGAGWALLASFLAMGRVRVGVAKPVPNADRAE
jgi:DHA1 family tetracycline resistance protein-like MFS transporter